ncbi:protein-glutamine gamma-glutamyltransferase [Cytobacillus sp. NCCP-133]|uniref:protein-glutamine gamma-glutamyltransferase n=1 Tax=Cytobacillus sp. NCCP-133 TaxID=766848 RepID=UPI00222E8D42|nr:protein-glutamine gamma-glutamyltransferase [Cytobacillus sp. NCCP-133]GLB60478.1 protein-glutamine gamma-glutamyltransferase [Cytobacillus sp. NCCP-133]
MIVLANNQSKPGIDRFFGVQREIFFALENSPEVHQYDSMHELLFEIMLRENIINAARQLHASPIEFAPFNTSRFNPLIWRRTKYGYLLDPAVLPSDAIMDVYIHSREYAFECTTAIVLIFYKAVLGSISVSRFNTLFQGLLVWDWNYDYDLSIITKKGRNFIPGDVVYFYNPDYEHPVWMGENAVYLGGGMYFGHGIGMETEAGMIRALNTLRKPGSMRDAYLISQHSRLNVKYLSQFAKRPLSFA